VKYLIERLKHKVEKNDTQHKCVVLLSTRKAFSLYKLAHTFEYLQCNNLFTIKKSTTRLVLPKIVHDVNKVFKD
jgi:hypothetical protein